MKKWKLISCLCLLGAATLASCGENGEEDPIKFFGWGSAEEQENFQIMINNFMDYN